MDENGHLDIEEQLAVRIVHAIRELWHSNTFWLCVLWMAWEFAQHIDAGWLAAHVDLKTWTPPTIAAMGVLVKVLQNMNLGKKAADQ